LMNWALTHSTTLCSIVGPGEQRYNTWMIRFFIISICFFAQTPPQ
jgi:hypothetical protein